MGRRGCTDAEAYESAIRVIGLDDNESDEGDHHGEISAIRPTMTPTTPRSPAYRAEADRVASDSLIEPGDLWRDGATVADTRAPGDVEA
jgi:hypothetical protein